VSARKIVSAAPDADTTGRRFTDRKTGETIVKVFQGDLYVTDDPTETLSCILGSCVAVCLRDGWAGLGGMNHFLLPYRDAVNGHGETLDDSDITTAQTRYGNHAIDSLIGRIIALGGRRDRLEAKVFGGASVLDTEGRIGAMNAEFAERYLQQYGIPIVSRSLRGDLPTMIRFRPVDGRAFVRRAQSETRDQIAKTETRRRVRLHKNAESGMVEMYD
jgi:chemotaxis protein CheD